MSNSRISHAHIVDTDFVFCKIYSSFKYLHVKFSHGSVREHDPSLASLDKKGCKTPHNLILLKRFVNGIPWDYTEDYKTTQFEQAAPTPLPTVHKVEATARNMYVCSTVEATRNVYIHV